MSSKQLIRIALALGAAVFLWGLAVILRGGSDDVERGELVSALVEEQVDRILIQGGSDTITVARDGPTWRVNGFAADSTRIQEFFSAVVSAVEGDLVAQSASSHARMGVDEASAKQVRVYQGEQAVVDLLVGNSGRTFRSNYVRVRGQDLVYLLEGELSTVFGRSLSDWRDKRILVVAASDIGGIAIERGDVNYRLRSDDAGWVFGNGDPADSAAVTGYREKFSPLLAQGTWFASPSQADSADFDSPDRVLLLEGTAGDTLAALLFDEGGSGFWVREARGGTVFQLLQYKVNEITPTDDVFRPQVDTLSN